MEFKSTENLLKSEQNPSMQDNLPSNIQFVRTQTFDASSSSNSHSIRHGRKIVVENVQVHQPVSQEGPIPVPRNQKSVNKSKKIQDVIKTAKDSANEIIQMTTFSASVDEIESLPKPVSVEIRKEKYHGVEMEDFSDISSISSRSNKRKKDKNSNSQTDHGNFIVHSSGIWSETANIAVNDDSIQKLSEYEKENDESLKEKSSEVKVIDEKLKSKQGKSSEQVPQARSSKSAPKKSKPIKSESSQTLIRSSVTLDSSSEEEEDEEQSLEIEEKSHKKHHKKHHSKASSNSSQTSYSTSVTESKVSKEASDEISLEKEDDTIERSDQILGVYIHETTDLKFDIKIRDPRVRVSLVDDRTGGLSIYNSQTIKKKQMEQPFILPLTTKQCDFTSHIAIRCKWEELLCFNENLSHPDYKNIIIFFEILDYHNIGVSDDPDGFYEIAWAFLKPFRDGAAFHFNTRLKLQLYYYQKLTKRMKLNEHVPVYNQWSIKHKKYPAIIEVTVKEITPIEILSKAGSQERDNEKITEKFTKDLEHLKDTILGKVFQIPKKITYKKRSSRKGSLVTCFSSSGHYLAYTEVVEASQHNIMILSVPDFAVCHILRGHSGLIHDLEWINSTYLISASADKTSILWSIDNGIGLLLKIMPHTSFVYAARCLLIERHSLVIVTGGRDCLLRVWKCNEKRAGAEIHQELEGHDDYISCLACTKQRTLLSADANGVIIEWKYEHKSLHKERVIEVDKFRGQLITDMILHSTECKIFVQIEGVWEIFVLGLPSGVLIQKLDVKERPGAVHQRLSISSCGTYLLCPNGYHLVVYNQLTDQIITELKIPFVHAGKSFISGSCSTIRHQSLAISVYGEGGGLVVYGNEENHNEMDSKYFDGYVKSKESFELNEKTELGAHLKEMIQKIDDVFLGGNKNLTSKSMPELRELSDESNSDTVNEQLSEGEVEEELSKDQIDADSNASGTFTIERSPSPKKRQKTVQIHDPNRTFSISEKKEAPIPAKRSKDKKPVARDRTFSIEDVKNHDNADDDDTTISESFH
uniref:CSON012678 protein n=1 Tax=Culicoides sonorensis TaxID=179676 RepID=A0A336M610_CULSO